MKYGERQLADKAKPAYVAQMERENQESQNGIETAEQPRSVEPVYVDAPSELNFLTLQQNLQTKTVETSASVEQNAEIGIGAISAGASINFEVSASVSRARTHGTSHTESVSDSVSKSLTHGLSISKSSNESVVEKESDTHTVAYGKGAEYSEAFEKRLSTNAAYTKVLTDTFGSSQGVTLNVQNKSLLGALERLEHLLTRLDECESIGMWDFAAYFLGESAAEAETAASIYRSLISGNQSGLQLSAVNTWSDEPSVNEILKYIRNFYHPVFLHQLDEGTVVRQTAIDPTVLTSTNELAIQLGLSVHFLQAFAYHSPQRRLVVKVCCSRHNFTPLIFLTVTNIIRYLFLL